MAAISPCHPIFRVITRLTFNDAEIAALHIWMGIQVNISAKSPSDALYAATQGKSSLTVSKLLSAALLKLWIPVVDAVVSYGYLHGHEIEFGFALTDAAEIGNILAMKLATRYGGDFFDTALAEAARGGHLAAMRETVRCGADDFDWALRSAASGGSIRAVKMALKHGATDLDGALRCAALTGKLDVVKFLIEKGATGYAEALENARAWKQTHVEKYLLTL